MLSELITPNDTAYHTQKTRIPIKTGCGISKNVNANIS